MKNFSLLLMVTITATLSACVVGPDFQTPPMPGNDHYSATNDVVPTQSNANVEAQQITLGAALPADWWGLFKNDVLAQLVQQALDHNQNIVAAQATVQQMQA